jgi:hypothetical protein
VAEARAFWRAALNMVMKLPIGIKKPSDWYSVIYSESIFVKFELSEVLHLEKPNYALLLDTVMYGVSYPRCITNTEVLRSAKYIVFLLELFVVLSMAYEQWLLWRREKYGRASYHKITVTEMCVCVYIRPFRLNNM